MVFSLAAGLLPIVLLSKGYADTVEPALLRTWFALRGVRPVPQSVSIVRIDKPAYDKVNRSPGELFPRQFLAEAIEKVAASGAKLIVLDAIAHRPGDKPESDERFARVLAATPTVIARGSEVVIDSDLSGRQRKTTIRHKPIKLFAESAKGVIPMEVRPTGERVEQIRLSSDRVVFSEMNVPLLGPLRQFVRPDIEEPGGSDYINFYGPPSTLPSVSLGQVLGDKSAVPAEYFRDRVVFIGSQSATGTGAEAGKDSFLTSASSEWMFGVEIHATIAANLLDGSWLRRLPSAKENILLGLVSFAAALAALSVSMSAGAIIALVSAAAWLAASYFAFLRLYFFLPGLVVVAVLVLLVVIRWAAVATSLGRRRKPRRITEDQAA